MFVYNCKAETRLELFLLSADGLYLDEADRLAAVEAEPTNGAGFVQSPLRSQGRLFVWSSYTPTNAKLYDTARVVTLRVKGQV